MIGTKCQEIFKESTTLFVDDDDTFVLNCSCFRENESSWKGPDGSKPAQNNTVLTTYSDGVRINPFLNITNVVVYGNYKIGLCFLKITTFSRVNDGLYECSYLLSGNLHIRRYHIYSRRSKLNVTIWKTLMTIMANNRYKCDQTTRILNVSEWNLRDKLQQYLIWYLN